MKRFYIDEKYLTSVVDTKMIVDETKSPEEQMLDKLSEAGVCYISTHDHPEFTELREQLEKEGYIRIEKSHWNGDVVLKPFLLNDKLFNTHEQFVCASAMRYNLRSRKFQV